MLKKEKYHEKKIKQKIGWPHAIVNVYKKYALDEGSHTYAQLGVRKKLHNITNIDRKLHF